MGILNIRFWMRQYVHLQTYKPCQSEKARQYEKRELSSLHDDECWFPERVRAHRIENRTSELMHYGLYQQTPGHELLRPSIHIFS